MTDTRYDQMREQVQRFHDEHPEVWDLFVRFTLEKINREFSHYSARGIFHRIRWETDDPSYEKGLEFKLNDHHSPFYARRFHKMYPKHEGFFRTREQISSRNDPSGLPELGPADYEEDHYRV
tara:strand:+ start:313 stop:678 length:366 start_codon:yes stop_codon:yes gene_type:complete